MRKLLPTAALLMAVLVPASAALSANDAPATPKQKAPGLGDPGKLSSIVIDTGRAIDGRVVIAGRDSYQQLVVTGNYDSGQVRDLSRLFSYTVSPDNVVRVDANGFVTPLAEGEATVHVRSPEGPDATMKVAVTNIVQDVAVNFPNQVVPVFTLRLRL